VSVACREKLQRTHAELDERTGGDGRCDVVYQWLEAVGADATMIRAGWDDHEGRVARGGRPSPRTWTDVGEGRGPAVG
jgi:hypothetical protein